MRTLSLTTVVCLMSIACSGSASEPQPEALQPEAIQPDAIAEKRAKARSKITAPDEAALKATRARMLAALNEGRKLVKDGQLEAGIAKYEELLAIAPNYAPALGELGWAEFNAGKLDDAHAHTLRALSLATDANKRGMLLYNLGRVAEQRGQTEAAIGHYRESLVARPNETVAARLTKLAPDAPAAVIEPARSGLDVIASGLVDLDAACKAAGRDSMCGADDGCELVATPEGDESWGMLVLDDFIIQCWNPIVKTPSGWVLFETALIGQQGSEVDQDVDELGGEVEKNDAGEFLRIAYSDHTYERPWNYADLEDDEGYPPLEDLTETEGVLLCRRDQAAPRCTQTITVKYNYAGNEGAVVASYAAELSLRGDTIVLSNVKREGQLPKGTERWGDDLLLEAGEYSFAELSPR
jgi:tetratricopeptide (TPR) repeat protein